MENQTYRITNDLVASKGERFIHYIVDLIIQYVLLFALSFAIGFVSTLFGDYTFVEWIENMNGMEEYLLGVLLILIYYNCTEIFFSRSIAKFITGTIVVMEDGSRPDPSTIIKRTFCRLIPFNHFSFFGNRGWHDSISETYVVKREAMERARDIFHDFNEIGNREEL